MLVGLAAKNGILIVDFANQLRDEGRSVTDAIVEAAGRAPAPDPHDLDRDHGGRRAARAAGGPGSASRSTIGVVVIFGVAFSTLLSLYVVPSFYALLAPYTRSPEALVEAPRAARTETPRARRPGLSQPGAEPGVKPGLCDVSI